MEVKVFLENGAKLPERQHDGDYCYDVYATSLEVVNGIYIYGTGIHTAFPSHVPETKTAICLQPFARSGIFKTGLILCNGVGIVDSNYRKEIHGMFYKICEGIEPIYKVGERFMQIALSNGEDIEWVQVNSLEELGTTDRDGGFSSTGRQ